jgi:hypothetical protein
VSFGKRQDTPEEDDLGGERHEEEKIKVERYLK